MNNPFIAYLFFLVVLGSPVLHAAEKNNNPLSVQESTMATTDIISLDFSVDAPTRRWARWILEQVYQLPVTRAKLKDREIALENQAASRKPLYNPELTTSVSLKNENEYVLSLSQTLDWFDKQKANRQLADVNLDIAGLNIKLALEQLLAEAILSYIDYHTEKQLLEVAKQQEELLNQLATQMKKKQKLGDIGAIDAEMTYISLSQNLQQVSLREINFRKAKTALEQKLNTTDIDKQASPRIWLNHLSQSQLQQVMAQNLNLRLSQRKMQQAQKEAQLARLQKYANPTFAAGIGVEGSDNLFNLDVSIPLNFRNDYSAQYRAALRRVEQAELEWQEQRRILDKQVRQAYETYHDLKLRVSRWQQQTQKRIRSSKQTLTRLWQTGDMATADYLFSLQQQTEALIATIQLEAEMQKAWIQWLLLSHQVASWLNSLKGA